MTANLNAETGIFYGVIYGNNLPYLMEDIIARGESTSVLQYKDQICSDLECAVKRVLDNYCTERVRNRILEALFVFDEVWDTMCEHGILDDVTFEEETYRWEHKRHGAYSLSWLGGAPLIWCIKTPFVMDSCPVCSLCVPNAGNIDSAIEGRSGGVTCYLPPADFFEGGVYPTLIADRVRDAG